MISLLKRVGLRSLTVTVTPTLVPRRQPRRSPALLVRAAGNPADVHGRGHPLHDGVLVAAIGVQRELLRDLVHPHQLACSRERGAAVRPGSTRHSLSIKCDAFDIRTTSVVFQDIP